jgi:hypothetical protein
MTDAERQRRRRQRLRQAQANSVTAEVSRNEEASEKRVDRLRNENKRLREDAKVWKRLHDNVAAMGDRLRKEHDQELKKLREEVRQYGDWKFEKHLSALEALLKPPVLKKWYDDLAKRYHSDRGGSNEEMKVVNEARDTLLALLKAAKK